MVKKKKSQRKSIKQKNTFYSFVYYFKSFEHKQIVVIGLTVIILIAGFYFNQPEDLGAQLPPPPADALYKQANVPIDKRVDDLLSHMTLEEKIGQMSLVDKNSLGKVEDISKYYLGGILSGAGAKPKNNTPQGWLDMINEMKNQASISRLGIPILYGVDSNHGHANVLGATVFPHSIGLGATQNPKLVAEIATATSEELATTGVNWSYSPSLDAPKDIRWGRVYEAFSDDPELIGKMGISYITGTQKTLENNTFIMAAAKHYLGTGAMNWGQSNHKQFKIDQGKTTDDKIALKNEYLPPFKEAVDAGVSSIMVALNNWGDERVIDSKYLLTDTLKGELGFKGFVVSDWYGVYEYAETNKYEANVKTINAGLDMAMLPYDYKAFLKDVRKAVNNGDIQQSRIDDAVSRILYQKFKAGLFDIKSNDTDIENFGSTAHRLLARRAVAESAVLLKNNESLLPLSKDTQKILISGSGANNVGRQSGAWTIEWQGVDGNWMPGVTSILQGINQELGDRNNVVFEENGNFNIGQNKADVGIAVVSEKPYAEGWGDNPNPTISNEDLELIKKLKQSSKKLVVVIISGRPLIITNQISNWDAVIAGWLPGSEGSGLADVLFGDSPFLAKLPITWPANIQQLPIKADGSTNDGTAPLFIRGYGL